MFGIIIGSAYFLYSLAITPDQFGIDFEIYRAAAKDLYAGQKVYGRSPVGAPNLTYRYPVILLAVFSIYLLFSPLVGLVIHVAGTVIVSVLLGLAIAKAIESHGVTISRYDCILICGFIVIGPVGAPSLVNGNVNHHIAAALGLGLVWLEFGHQKRAGVALGLAALPKVFPAAVGIWMIWRRTWRAVFVAIATGVGALAAGAVIFGWSRTQRYFVTELLPRLTASSASGGLSPSSHYVTLQRPLTMVFPDGSGTLLTAISLLLLSPIVAYTYLYSNGPLQRLIALLTTLCAILLVVPSYTMYFLLLSYPLIPLLYLLSNWSGRMFSGGVILLQFTLKLHDANTVVRQLGLPSWATEAVLASLQGLYTLGTPVLWGTVTMLAAGIWEIHSNHSVN